MSYYLLERDGNYAKEVPQTKTLPSYPLNHPDSMVNIRERIPIAPVLIPEGLELKPRAQWTDYLSCFYAQSPFIIISESFKKILTEVRVSDQMEFFPLHIRKQQEERLYFVAGENPGHPEWIDYARSPVVKEDFLAKTQEEIWIKNSEEFADLRKKNNNHIIYTIKRPKLLLDAVTLDFFWTGWGTTIIQYLVSERVVELAREKSLEGLIFTPLEDRGFI